MKDFTKTVLKTGLAVCVLGGLAAYAYYGEFKKGREQEKAKEESKKLFTVRKDTATALKLTARGAEIGLAKTDGRWRVVAPVQTEADQTAVDGIVNAFDTLRVERAVEEKAADLKAYGLDTPEITAVVTADGQTLGLRVGMKNEFDNTYYVMRDGDPKVYQAPSSVKTLFDKDLFAVRDKRLVFAEKNEEIVKLEVKANGAVYALAREGDRWTVSGIASDRADDEEVTKVLNAIRSLRGTAIAAEREPADSPGYGLKNAPYVISVWKGPENALQQVWINKADAGGKTKIYARRSGAETVWEVGEQILKDIDKKPFDLRFKKVMDFKRDDVKRLVMESGGATWTLEKGTTDAGDQWEISAPEKAKAKPYKVSSVLYNFSNLKAAEFSAAGPVALKEYELETPARSAVLYDGMGNEIGRMAVGKNTTGGAAVLSNLRPNVVFVEKARIDDIPWALADYKDETPKTDAGTAPKGK